MAQRNIKRALLVPADGVIHFSADFSFGQSSDVDVIKVTFPKGCVGKVDAGVIYAQQQVIPEQENDKLIGNNQTYVFDLVNYPLGGQWSVFGTNHDIYPHTIRFLFGINTQIPESAEDDLPIILLPWQG